jgi:hypothetical protein
MTWFLPWLSSRTERPPGGACGRNACPLCQFDYGVTIISAVTVEAIIQPVGNLSDTVRALALWSGPADIAPLDRGITNRNYVANRG